MTADGNSFAPYKEEEPYYGPDITEIYENSPYEDSGKPAKSWSKVILLRMADDLTMNFSLMLQIAFIDIRIEKAAIRKFRLDYAENASKRRQYASPLHAAVTKEPDVTLRNTHTRY